MADKIILEGRVVVNGDPKVQPQRLEAYAYAELRPQGTRRAFPAPGGGEVHNLTGIEPIPPGDWVVELPTGGLAIVEGEEIASHWEFVDGPEVYAEQYRVALANKAAAEEQDRLADERARAQAEQVKVETEVPRELHPDHGEAAELRDAARTLTGDRSGNQDDFLAHVNAQRQKLLAVVQTAEARGLIDPGEAALWAQHGVTPARVEVTFDDRLGTFSIERAPAPAENNDPGTGGATLEGEAAAPEGYEAAVMQELWQEAHQREGIEIVGTGKDGAVRKVDLVEALRKNDIERREDAQVDPDHDDNPRVEGSDETPEPVRQDSGIETVPTIEQDAAARGVVPASDANVVRADSGLDVAATPEQLERAQDTFKDDSPIDPDRGADVEKEAPPSDGHGTDA